MPGCRALDPPGHEVHSQIVDHRVKCHSRIGHVTIVLVRTFYVQMEISLGATGLSSGRLTELPCGFNAVRTDRWTSEFILIENL